MGRKVEARRASRAEIPRLVFYLNPKFFLNAHLTFHQRRCIHDEFGNIDPVKQNEPVVPRGPTKPKNKIHPTSESPAAKRVKKESHTDVPNTYTFDANQQPTASESTSSLERLMDPAIFDTMNLPPTNAEEPTYDSAAWFNERQMETAESLYNSMINHTSPAPEMSYPPEPQADDAVAHSIESAVPTEQANHKRNLALEAMATAADALLDPALLEESARETNMAPSPNFDVVQGKVVPWGSVSSGEDQELVPNGWPALETEDQSLHAPNLVQADVYTEQPQGHVDHTVSHDVFDEPSEETVETQSGSFQTTESMDDDLRLQHIGRLLQQETSQQDVQMSNIDPLLENVDGEAQQRDMQMSNIDPSLEEAYSKVSEHTAEISAIDSSLDEAYNHASEQDMQISNIDPSLEEAYGEISKHREAHLMEEVAKFAKPVETMELDTEAETTEAIDATFLEVQPLAELVTTIPRSPVLANGIISPITPRAISVELAMPANNNVVTFAESADSRRQSTPHPQSVDSSTVESASKSAETTKTRPMSNGSTKNTSPLRVRKPGRSNTPLKTPSKPKIVKTDISQTPRGDTTATIPETDEDTIKLIEQMRQEDLGLRSRRAS